MILSQKTLYAIRSIFELSKRLNQGPVKLPIIAREQHIPRRFLEVIMGELRQAKYVESRRGKSGGYMMARDPGKLTVGEIINFMEGKLDIVECLGGSHAKARCPLKEKCIFLPFWQKVANAISGVIDSTTFQDLIEEEKQSSQSVNWTI